MWVRSLVTGHRVSRVCITQGTKSFMSGYGETDFGTNAADISNIRKPYYPPKDAFTEDKLVSKDPIKQFQDWLNVAINHTDIAEPNAATLATADEKGRPSARMVLLKGFGQDGFRFFTNYNSRKAKELDVNPHACMVLYWGVINRSIRIEGSVEKCSKEDSDNYFATRPRRSQIAAHVSKSQSAPIDSRASLLAEEKCIAEKYEGGDIPRPEFWGGFIVKPHTIEFWQGQSNRMHDRIQFCKEDYDECSPEKSYWNLGENGWLYRRLFP